MQKHYISYESKEERIKAWKLNRTSYAVWRRSGEAKAFIRYKRRKQDNLCFICIRPLEELIHIDHIFPLWLGGTNAKGNMCIVHPKCNMDKGTQVYSTYKQACRRRRQFNLRRKAARASEVLRNNPRAKLSKKNQKAIRAVSRLRPLGH